MKIPLLAIASALVIHTLWGGNPVAVKLGLIAFPPLWSAFIRFAIGVLCIAVWARLNRIRIWPDSREWPGLFILAFLFTTQIGMMNFGINLTSGASAAVMTATFPLFAGLFAHFMIPGDRLTVGKVTGLLIAFLGVGLVLTGGKIPNELSRADVGDLIILASTVLLGGRMIWTARLLSSIEPARVVIWQMLLSLGVFATGAVLWEEISCLTSAGCLIAPVGRRDLRLDGRESDRRDGCLAQATQGRWCRRNSISGMKRIGELTMQVTAGSGRRVAWPHRPARVWSSAAWGLARLVLRSGQHAEQPPAKRRGPISDQAMVAIEADLEPLGGRGLPQRARLRVCRDIRVARKRVLRLMRENNLLSPHRCRHWRLSP